MPIPIRKNPCSFRAYLRLKLDLSRFYAHKRRFHFLYMYIILQYMYFCLIYYVLLFLQSTCVYTKCFNSYVFCIHSAFIILIPCNNINLNSKLYTYSFNIHPKNAFNIELLFILFHILNHSHVELFLTSIISHLR